MEDKARPVVEDKASPAVDKVPLAADKERLAVDKARPVADRVPAVAVDSIQENRPGNTVPEQGSDSVSIQKHPGHRLEHRQRWMSRRIRRWSCRCNRLRRRRRACHSRLLVVVVGVRPWGWSQC